MTDRDVGWVGMLDQLEADLVSASGAPAGRSARPGPFVAPDLGPIPLDLAERARAVLQAITDAEQAVRADLRRTSEQLQELRQLDPRAPRPPSRLDTRA